MVRQSIVDWMQLVRLLRTFDGVTSIPLGTDPDTLNPGTSDWGTTRSSIGHTGWPVTRSNTHRNACLPGTATALIARPLTVMSARIAADDMS